ncbi:hypothetical protein [Haloferax sp. DFSO60]|uniref:hypothetical protein n=1 Tax=Haloferax sp. DFSO60 TaxID=3388652 RepID=UPI003979320B
MSEKTTVEFIEEWQTGAFLVIGCVLTGVVGAMALVRIASVVLDPRVGWVGFVLGFFGSGLLAFVLFSVLLYGTD